MHSTTPTRPWAGISICGSTNTTPIRIIVNTRSLRALDRLNKQRPVDTGTRVVNFEGPRGAQKL